jgi:hypothetical protein
MKKPPRTTVANLAGPTTLSEQQLDHVCGAGVQFTRISITNPQLSTDFPRVDDH